MSSFNNSLESDFTLSRPVKAKRFLWFIGLYAGSLTSIGSFANGMHWALHYLA